MYKALIATVLCSVGLMGQANTGAVSGTGSIQGTVTDASTNKPIAGAIVTAISASSPSSTRSAPTAVDGSYQIKSVPAGTFSLCAWVLNQPYLDPCFGGGGTPPVVTLASGQQSTGNQINLQPDSRLIGPAEAAPGTGSIQGLVLDAGTSKPIGGAIVTAVSTTPPLFSQSGSAAADGSYQIQGLPAGTFALCAQAATDGYLSSCDWGAKPPTVTLTSGQDSAGNQLTMKTGSILKVRVQDPTQSLSQKTLSGLGPDLVMGVFGPQSLFYPAHQAGKDAGGANYQLTIPLDTRVTFSIASQSLKLADSNGVELPNSSSQQAVQQSTGNSNPPNLVYTIIGPKP